MLFLIISLYKSAFKSYYMLISLSWHRLNDNIMQQIVVAHRGYWGALSCLVSLCQHMPIMLDWVVEMKLSCKLLSVTLLTIGLNRRPLFIAVITSV